MTTTKNTPSGQTGTEPTKPRVLNKRVDGIPAGAVYVGRPSFWGNQYKIGKDGTRQQVVNKYRKKLLYVLEGNPEIKEKLIKELRGKDLVCWCSPLPCHADVLLEIANE